MTLTDGLTQWRALLVNEQAAHEQFLPTVQAMRDRVASLADLAGKQAEAFDARGTDVLLVEALDSLATTQAAFSKIADLFDLLSDRVENDASNAAGAVRIVDLLLDMAAENQT